MNNSEAYAKYQILPSLAYKIIDHLITNPNAEIIWRLLKYNTVDAYKQPNLSISEKRGLIYKGGGHQEDCSVFIDFSFDDATNEAKTFLRIYPATIFPTNRTIGICGINFEILSHTKINHLANYTTRVDTIMQAIISVLNGADIGGIGVMYFDRQRSSFDKSQLIGKNPYKGKLLTMSVNIG